VEGVDSDNVPYSLFKKVEFLYNSKTTDVLKEPFILKLKEKITEGKISLNMHF